MAKYVFIYHAPMTPADATPPTPEQMEAVMGQWNAWAAKVGDRMIDFGTPLDGGIRVTTAGTSPSTREVAGYSILEARRLRRRDRPGPQPSASQHARRLRDRDPRSTGHPRHVNHSLNKARRPPHREEPNTFGASRWRIFQRCWRRVCSIY